MLGPETLQVRIDELRRGPAFANYERVRAEVLRMRETELGADVERPGQYWLEELAGFDYMLDASPLLVEKLRQQTYHLTGLRHHDYRSHKSEAQKRFESKLKALLRVGDRSLLVPESPILGGYGYRIDGQLYNVDTLKFFEVLIGMDDAALLTDFRRAERRRTVWEIGGGWGGFAYAFKTSFPDVTYVISDFPEVFLFSAVYLMTAFPDAKVGFANAANVAETVASLEEKDFVFVPNNLTDAFRPARLDLTVNMVSFQEMTTEQVAAYVEHAFALECPYLYSLNRDRSPYNPELSNVREIIATRYWPHDISVLPISYTKLVDPKALKLRNPLPSKELEYRHVCGWRRADA